MSTPISSSEKDDHDDKYDKFRSEEETMRTSISTRKLIFYTFLASLVADTYALRLSSWNLKPLNSMVVHTPYSILRTSPSVLLDAYPVISRPVILWKSRPLCHVPVCVDLNCQSVYGIRPSTWGLCGLAHLCEGGMASLGSRRVPLGRCKIKSEALEGSIQLQ